MKATGIVRQLDTLGRIVVPIELRRTLDLQLKDSVEIYVNGNEIVLKKYHPTCIFCSNAHDLQQYKGKLICKSCRRSLHDLYP